MKAKLKGVVGFNEYNVGFIAPFFQAEIAIAVSGRMRSRSRLLG